MPIEQASAVDPAVLRLTSNELDLRKFERRDGEVLLRADVLGHRLIDVESARLVKAVDLELEQRTGDWVLAGVDTRRRPRRLLAAAAQRRGQAGASGLPRLGQVRAADRPRGQRPAARPVRPDPPAEAGPDRRPAGGGVQGGGIGDPRPRARRSRARGRRLRGARRGPGDPAARCPHRRGRSPRCWPGCARTMPPTPSPSCRSPAGSRCSTCCPAGQRTKVLTLMGFNPASAGGLMGVDFVAVPADAACTRHWPPSPARPP